jgi:hypothetical protein
MCILHVLSMCLNVFIHPRKNVRYFRYKVFHCNCFIITPRHAILQPCLFYALTQYHYQHTLYFFIHKMMGSVPLHHCYRSSSRICGRLCNKWLLDVPLFSQALKSNGSCLVKGRVCALSKFCGILIEPAVIYKYQLSTVPSLMMWWILVVTIPSPLDCSFSQYR